MEQSPFHGIQHEISWQGSRDKNPQYRGTKLRHSKEAVVNQANVCSIGQELLKGILQLEVSPLFIGQVVHSELNTTLCGMRHHTLKLLSRVEVHQVPQYCSNMALLFACISYIFPL